MAATRLNACAVALHGGGDGTALVTSQRSKLDVGQIRDAIADKFALRCGCRS